jgi:hypothetical protein
MRSRGRRAKESDQFSIHTPGMPPSPRRRSTRECRSRRRGSDPHRRARKHGVLLRTRRECNRSGNHANRRAALPLARFGPTVVATGGIGCSEPMEPVVRDDSLIFSLFRVRPGGCGRRSSVMNDSDPSAARSVSCCRTRLPLRGKNNQTSIHHGFRRRSADSTRGYGRWPEAGQRQDVRGDLCDPVPSAARSASGCGTRVPLRGKVNPIPAYHGFRRRSADSTRGNDRRPEAGQRH